MTARAVVTCGGNPVPKIQLSEMELAAITLVAEDAHRKMLGMVETHGRDNPLWQQYANAWASIRRKLTGSDEL